MKLNWEQYDLMIMEEDVRKEVFNEIADAVVSREGNAYRDACEVADGKKSSITDGEIREYIKSITWNMLPSMSMSIMDAFNKQAAEPEAIRQAYEGIRERHKQHYEKQIRGGESLTSEDEIFNAHVRLNKAIAGSYIDRVLARIPQ